MDRECASQSARFRKLWDLNHQELGIGGRLHPRLCESPKPATSELSSQLWVPGSMWLHARISQTCLLYPWVPLILMVDGCWSCSVDLKTYPPVKHGKLGNHVLVEIAPWTWVRPPRYCKAFRIDGNPDRTSFISLEQAPKMVDFTVAHGNVMAYKIAPTHGLRWSYICGLGELRWITCCLVFVGKMMVNQWIFDGSL